VAKGEVIEQYRAAHGGADPFEDRSIAILSRIEMEVPRHLAAPILAEASGP
jgi:hypothetical protein